MAYENPFKTVYRGDFIWPYIAPITFKACKPAEGWTAVAAPKDSLVDVKMCQCDRHDWSPHFRRAKHLKQKERAFREAMIAVAAERTVLENEILQHPCANAEDALISIYGSDYSKAEFPVSDFRSMKKDHDDPVVSPVPMPKDPRTSSYRDVSAFKTVALESVDIQAPRDLNFDSSTQPVIHEPNPYISEYMGVISKAGKANLTNAQRLAKMERSRK